MMWEESVYECLFSNEKEKNEKCQSHIENGSTFLVDIYINPFSLTLWPLWRGKREPRALRNPKPIPLAWTKNFVHFLIPLICSHPYIASCFPSFCGKLIFVLMQHPSIPALDTLQHQRPRCCIHSVARSILFHTYLNSHHSFITPCITFFYSIRAMLYLTNGVHLRWGSFGCWNLEVGCQIFVLHQGWYQRRVDLL